MLFFKKKIYIPKELKKKKFNSSEVAESGLFTQLQFDAFSHNIYLKDSKFPFPAV